MTIWQDLDFLSPDEFVTLNGTDWSDDMSHKLLCKTDAFRAYTGHPILISRHDRALGRHDGDSTSGHNIDRWGQVLALDAFPTNMTTPTIAERYVELAIKLGFRGIGIYPQWNQGPGMHFDVRPTRPVGKPALWGMVRGAKGGQVQVSLEHALKVWRSGL